MSQQTALKTGISNFHEIFHESFLVFIHQSGRHIPTIKSVSRNNEIILETLLEIVTAYARNSLLLVKNVTPKGVFFLAS